MFILKGITGLTLSVFCLLGVSTLVHAQNDSTCLAQGLMQASSAKMLVVDNAANGYPLDYGWEPIIPTVCTRSISIDEGSGVISIVGNSANANNAPVLTLTPNAAEKPLANDMTLNSPIVWECKVIQLGFLSQDDVPEGCQL